MEASLLRELDKERGAINRSAYISMIVQNHARKNNQIKVV